MRFLGAKLALIATSTFIVVAPAVAEYRAYELKIDNSETNKSHTVISSLDHLQYPVYFPLNKGETIQYVDSWMCWENSSYFKKPCAKPDRTPAAAKPKAESAQKNPSPAAKGASL